MSTITTMCLVNLSGSDITDIKISQTSGFENAGRDLSFLQGNPVPTYVSLCSYVKLDSMTPTYTVSLTFADGSAISFTDNQGHDWSTKWAGPIAHNGTQNLTVWRTLGGNVSGTAGTNGIYIRPAQAPDNSSWMGDLLKRKPNVRLCDLIMPGSHDAGMYIAGTTTWSNTQDLSILDQLKAGSRYFDLRVCMNAGGTEVWTYHGPSWGDSLTNILNQVQTFLTGVGATETVVFKFSHAYANARQPTVQKLLNFTPIYKQSLNVGTQLLSSLKGKLVAVFSSDDESFESWWNSWAGIFSYHDVDTWAPLPVPVSGDGLTVYDNYSNDGTYEKMVADQNPKLSKYGGWGKDYLFLLSWTLTGGGDVSDVSVLASMANPWLPRKLGEVGSIMGTRPGVVYLDFVDPYICKAITSVNDDPLYVGPVKGALEWVSVGSDGDVWGVNKGGIYHFENGQWGPQVTGTLNQISVGNAQNIWGVYNGTIVRREGATWIPVNGPALSQISVASDGTVWGITTTGEVYRADGQKWDLMQGTLTSISVASATEVWGVNATSGGIFKWNPNAQPGQPQWTEITGQAAMIAISAASDGSIWAVGANKKAYLRRGQGFYPAGYNSQGQPGGLDFTQISAGSSAQIWAVNSATGEICAWS